MTATIISRGMPDVMTANRHSAAEIARVLESTPTDYREFLRVPSMSAGVYRLAAGASDDQTPHTEDEVYYVLAGRARLRIGEREEPANPGDVLFVPAGEVHRFVVVEESLHLLVVFAPAEGTRSLDRAGPGTG
jgi:quercetin dioxygenase-like cupin family protein